MIRAAVAFVSTVVFVFSVTFVVAHALSAEPERVPRLATAPASPGTPPRVSTIGHAAALPALRRPGPGARPALVTASPPPSPASPRAKAARD